MDNNPIRKFLKKKQWAFRTIFNGDDGTLNESAKIALADLRTFCGATKSSFSADAITMARNEGRREVFTRIMNFLEIDYSGMYRLEEEFED